MNIALERDAARDGRPVYRQIAAHIKSEIDAGHLDGGVRLPAIRNLARTLKVNRDTVALAYEALSETGHVESSVGRGTFVRAAEPACRPEEVFQPVFSPLTEKLRDFERARPRFGEAAKAVAMHSLVPDPSLYPIDGFRKALNRALQQGGPELLLKRALYSFLNKLLKILKTPKQKTTIGQKNRKD